MLKKGIAVKTVALIAMFFFMAILGGCNLVRMNPEADKKQTVAEIGEEKITKQEVNYYMTVEKYNWEMQGQTFPTDEETLSQIKSQILDSVVENQLMVQAAKGEEITVDEEAAETQVEDLKIGLQEDLGGEEEYKKFLEDNDVTVEEFDTFLKNYLLSNQYIMGLYEKITKDVTVSEEEVKQYYEDNKMQFDPSTVEAKHILSTSKEQAEEIINKSKEGKDFDALMEEYREKEGIQEAADLGEFQYSDMVPEFSEAAFSLEPGDVSGVVETQYGFHVIKLEKKTTKEVQSYEDVKESINLQLVQSAQYEAFNTYITEKMEELEIKKYPEKL